MSDSHMQTFVLWNDGGALRVRPYPHPLDPVNNYQQEGLPVEPRSFVQLRAGQHLLLRVADPELSTTEAA